MVRIMRSNVLDRRLVDLKVYGWLMMFVLMMLLVMFMNVDDRFDLGWDVFEVC